MTLKNQQLGQVSYDKLIFATSSFFRLPVILGSGAIGVELARILVKRGMKVTLIERDKRIMGRTLDVQASMALEKELISDGIDV